jgi:hypothetical protein
MPNLSVKRVQESVRFTPRLTFRAAKPDHVIVMRRLYRREFQDPRLMLPNDRCIAPAAAGV